MAVLPALQLDLHLSIFQRTFGMAKTEPAFFFFRCECELQRKKAEIKQTGKLGWTGGWGGRVVCVCVCWVTEGPSFRLCVE